MIDTGNRRLDIARSYFLVALSLFFLNLPLSLYVWAPVGRPVLMLVPVIESIVILWLLLLALRPQSTRSLRRALTISAGALYGILIGFAVAEAFFRYYFARAFLPRGDIGMIRGALLLFLGDIGETADILTPITIVLLFLVLGTLGVLALRGIRALLIRAPARIVPAAVLSVGFIPLLIAVGLPRSLTGMAASALVQPEEIGFLDIDIGDSGSIAVDATEGSAPRYTFPGIKDRDIYFFVIEAYGYASVIRPELAEEIDPHRDRFARALQANGYGVRSSYLESPVAGGYSWLAEATMLTGQWINSQERFLQLYDQQLPSLSGMLNGGGYYTLTIRPGTVHGEWPEGWDLFRFEEAMIAHGDGFSFRGPWFSYVPVTDQFALWAGEKRVQELISDGGEAEQRPMFTYYQLVSSHTPFNRIPPIIDPWSDLGDGSVYLEREGDIQRFNNSWTGGSELEEGYVAAIGYVFDVLTEYVDTIMNHDRDPLIVLYGDHQPQRPIRSADAFLSIPIHVASRDPEVLALFESRGFEPGMKSNEMPPHRRMDQFFPMFAELISTPADALAINRE